MCPHPASQYKVTAIKKNLLHSSAAQKPAEPEEWAMSSWKPFLFSFIRNMNWINIDWITRLLLLKPTLFLGKPFSQVFPYRLSGCSSQPDTFCSLTAGLNVTFCLSLCRESICSRRGFFSLGTSASSHPVPTDFFSPFIPLSCSSHLWSHTLHWMDGWMNEWMNELLDASHCYVCIGVVLGSKQREQYRHRLWTPVTEDICHLNIVVFFFSPVTYTFPNIFDQS